MKSDVIRRMALMLAAALGSAAARESGMKRTIQTKHLRVVFTTAAATWSVEHKGSRSRVALIRPQLAIAGMAVDLSRYQATLSVTDANDALGEFKVVEATYRSPRALEVRYRIAVSEAEPEAIVELGFTNHTGTTLEVRALRPMVADGVSLGGSTTRWRAIGDGRNFNHPCQSFTVASMGRKDVWWYGAAKNTETGRSILMGNLTNHKGIGRFTLEARDRATMAMTAWCDYEGITMPPRATIAAEKVLVHFGERGTDSLLRLGTLIAKAHDIDLAKLAPLDPDDATIAAVFNTWNSYGSGVVRGVRYSHDRAEHKKAFQDADWRRKCERIYRELGIPKFIHPDLPDKRRPSVGGVTPLARCYGKPDWWFPAAEEIYDKHRRLYLDDRIDFSNPATQELERSRAESLFERGKGKMVHFGADFTDRWSRLPGQHDAFMTSAETYHAAMRPWRELQRKHTGGAYGRVCMNPIGYSYDVWDIVRIGGDSDQHYYRRPCAFATDLIRQASGRFHLSGTVWWNNPDSFHVYCQGIYSHAQAKVHASFCAIAGNRMMVAEPFCDQTLPADRLEIIKRVMPATADTAVAVDCFEHSPARIWHLPIRRPFGAWSIVGLFNFDEDQKKRPHTLTARFADLGLSASKDYLVYGFWGRSFLGVKRGSFLRTLKAPDCEVYAVVEKLDRPVLLSTSRHVRHMAYDIVSLVWDGAKRELRGTSRVVAGDPCQLRVYVPKGYRLKTAEAPGLEPKVATDGPLLTIDLAPTLHGEQAWALSF